VYLIDDSLEFLFLESSEKPSSGDSVLRSGLGTLPTALVSGVGSACPPDFCGVTESIAVN